MSKEKMNAKNREVTIHNGMTFIARILALVGLIGIIRLITELAGIDINNPIIHFFLMMFSIILWNYISQLKGFGRYKSTEYPEDL